jgi:hypothetical protein
MQWQNSMVEWDGTILIVCVCVWYKVTWIICLLLLLLLLLLSSSSSSSSSPPPPRPRPSLIILDVGNQTIAANVKVTGDWWIGKDLEGSCGRLIEVLPRHLLGRTEESHAESHLEQAVYYSYVTYIADASLNHFMAEYLQRVYVPHSEMKRNA